MRAINPSRNIMPAETLRLAVIPPAGARRGSPARFGPGQLLKWVAAVWKRSAGMAELAAKTDRELADIGLTRGDIKAVFDRRTEIGRLAWQDRPGPVR